MPILLIVCVSKNTVVTTSLSYRIILFHLCHLNDEESTKLVYKESFFQVGFE